MKVNPVLVLARLEEHGTLLQDHVVGTMGFGMIWMLTDAFVFMLRHGLNMYSSHSANIFEYPTIAICFNQCPDGDISFLYSVCSTLWPATFKHYSLVRNQFFGHDDIFKTRF